MVISFIFCFNSIKAQTKNRYRFCVGTEDFSKNEFNFNVQYERLIRKKTYLNFRLGFSIREQQQRVDYSRNKIFGSYIDKENILGSWIDENNTLIRDGEHFPVTNYFVTHDFYRYSFVLSTSIVRDFYVKKLRISPSLGLGISYNKLHGVFNAFAGEILDNGYPHESAVVLVPGWLSFYYFIFPVSLDVSYYITDNFYVGSNTFFGFGYIGTNLSTGLHFGIDF